MHHKYKGNPPFVEISIKHIVLIAIFDFNANQTIIGRKGVFLLEEPQLKLDKIENSFYLQTADGNNQYLLGSVCIPVTIGAITKLHTTLASCKISTNLT